MVRTESRRRMKCLSVLALLIGLWLPCLAGCQTEAPDHETVTPEPRDVREPTSDERESMFRAASRGNDEELRRMLEDGIDPNATDDEGFIALHAAARFGHVESAVLLLEKGTDINHQSNNGNTPLHWAARAGQYNMAEFLLDAGADPNLRNEVGGTPMRFALNNNYRQIVELLIARGGTE